VKRKVEIILGTALDQRVILRALKVALVTGTFLNLINQGDRLIALNFGEVNYVKLFLTFLAPFAVSAYTAISMALVSETEIQAGDDESGRPVTLNPRKAEP
jgi:hypothetical protein